MKCFDNKPTSVLCASDLKSLKGKVVYWAIFAILVIMCVIAVLPSFWAIMNAFKETQEIYSGFKFFPENMSPDHLLSRITTSWNELELGRSYINTIVMSLGSVAMMLVVCGLSGFAISRLKPFGSALIFTLIVWTMMIPSQMRTVPLYISWMNFPFLVNSPLNVNILDTYWPMWLSAAGNAFNILLFKNYFDSVSISLIEAAKLDGCGNIKIFSSIMLPLSTPIIIYVTITGLCGVWSEFFTPYLVISDDAKQVLPVKIFLMKSDTTVKMNTYMMGLIFASIPQFLIFVLFQRHIMGGINIGGVKG